MLFGSIINIMIPLTLPWSFFMIELGVRNYQTKLNSVFYLILFFVVLVFPIYYFFELLQEKSKKQASVRKENLKTRLIANNQIKANEKR